ncbi:retinol dehydrogenase 7-like [Gastrophryne carolinensis]
MWHFLLAVLGLLLLYRWYRQSLILKNLTDKYVFITGCDSGFGNQLAKQLDQRGMKVLAACLTENGAENLRKETSSRLQTVILDVSNSLSVSSAGEWVSKIVKDKGLWGLVNNAGIAGTAAPNSWLKKDDYLNILNVNLLGMIDMTLTLLPLIRKASGRIVNVSSSAGRVVLLSTSYSISKYGVEAFSDGLRNELADFGIKVCIIEPGAFKTPAANFQIFKAKAEETWEALPVETKKLYGEQYLKEFVQGIHTLLSTGSPKLFKVTDCMEHALTACYPWTRYAPGWDAKLFYIPLSYLPTCITDYIARRNAPKPAQRAE